jgi:hypothetical protein
MSGHVRGSFFSEYVRMLRRRKDIDWARILPAEDVQYLQQRIDADSWYPMATFERFGVAILATVEGATLDAVRLWGRFSANDYATSHAELIALGEPEESLMRLRVMRATLFDFPAFDIPMLVDGHAYVVVHYRMGRVAEEAACVQTMGFCEGVLSLAGAQNIQAAFAECSWKGDGRTRISLEWETPSAPSSSNARRR